MQTEDQTVNMDLEIGIYCNLPAVDFATLKQEVVEWFVEYNGGLQQFSSHCKETSSYFGCKHIYL